MTRVLSWSFSFLAVSLGVFALTAAYESHVLSAKAGATLAGIDNTVGTVRETVSTLNQTLVTINKPKYGIIAELGDNLKNSRLALDNFNAVALEERFFLEKTQPEEVAKLNSVLDSTNVLIQSSTKNEQQLTEAAIGSTENIDLTIKDLVPVEQNLAKVTVDLDTLVTDPNIKSTIEHANESMTQVDSITTDGAHWVHQNVYPGPWARIWGYVSGVGLDAAKFFIP